ncbi:MAG: hypothetical protein QM783_04440 [Phycisphaerales bacterium]
MNRYDLYRWCVQDAPAMCMFLASAHAKNPRTLREDFAGPAGLAAEWANLSARHKSVAVDIDREPLDHAPDSPRLTKKIADATRTTVKADVIALFNFAVGEIHDRDKLVAYFRTLRRSLHTRGIAACDIYGGVNAFVPGSLTTHARVPESGKRIRYTWQQASADPTTGMVENRLHFAVGARKWPSAFVYNWRLWSIPELKDAFREAGFAKVDVYDRLGDAIDHKGNLRLRPVSPDAPLDEDYVVYLVARKS